MIPRGLWRRHEVRLTLTFVCLIILPCGFLGYFSLRAIRNEKLLIEARLQQNYKQLAGLAAREINEELEKAARHWTYLTGKSAKRHRHYPTPEALQQFAEEQPLVASAILLESPAQPPRTTAAAGTALPAAQAAPPGEDYISTHRRFTALVEAGEELEYKGRLEEALALYAQIAQDCPTPQFVALSRNLMGRVLMKQSDWPAAIRVYRELLANHPQVRDRNGAPLRFFAQYQIAMALANQNRDQEAVETLLAMHQDLFERSDEISTVQYTYFVELIQTASLRLLSSPLLSHPERYQRQFAALAELSKKRISRRYYLQVLDRRLAEDVLERKNYKDRVYYLSDVAEGEPYLLAYQYLPDASGHHVAGLVAMEIDLEELKAKLFPAILEKLEVAGAVSFAILNEAHKFMIGTRPPVGEPVATQVLEKPFDFWQVAIYAEAPAGPATGWDFKLTLSLWLVFLLLLTVIFGAAVFIRQALREAHVSQMKSTFVSNVSHELRTPLASIKMLAELLEKQFAAGPGSAAAAGRAAEYLGVIRRESDRLARLIESVLDFSRIERGVKQYTFEYEDPEAIVRQVVEAFRPQAEADGFHLVLEIAAPLPEVKIDADAIAQLLLNLLTNAYKYSQERKYIRVAAFRQARHLVIEVEDHGIGIDQAELPKIFEDFYRVDQRLNTPKQGGAGLGLTLARHLAAAHGGEITVRSKLGEGSTFSLRLPIPPECLEQMEAGHAREAPANNHGAPAAEPEV
ncbi:MAG: HAMP domain-containing histidine kinase [candidate division KSB1 bacterium]|nr:HAMP domain-containing histidine kinase [candidate division KSB1 bacterium]MDZ7273243.1 HAMP domain-containing histidine kinase [candidate division KSB1 bacterium]MDZ7285345.1 HAMP domain-containing histidine kinase [candidate division KSB1 bacterium]MDZ7298377.1 HAMP domain-containing histidine kinase [candidate division KSB1 bacterium]MDZ7306455.1 HAMP domain-containing histidine kinase [candidate division KSB1 bacterium]